MTYSPFREGESGPLTPDQERVSLAEGAPKEPSTAEEWNLHGCVSMQAISDAMQYKYGEYPAHDVGYRAFTPVMPGFHVMYSDISGDDYEVRAQPNPKVLDVSADPSQTEVAEKNQDMHLRTPEYKWSNVQAHLCLVQQHGGQRSIGEMDVAEAEVHAAYLREVAKVVAAELGDEVTFTRLTLPEHHEPAPEVPLERPPLERYDRDDVQT